jgi:hypothetical protein
MGLSGAASLGASFGGAFLSSAGAPASSRTAATATSSRAVASGGRGPQAAAAALQRSAGGDEHEDPPVQVGAAVADPQGERHGGAEPAAGQADEVSGVVLGHARLLGGAGVGEVVLAQPQLAPEPPEQRLVEEQEPGQARQVPAEQVAALDVRPLVCQAVTQGGPVAGAAQGAGQDDGWAAPAEQHGQVKAVAGQEPDAPGRRPGDPLQQFGHLIGGRVARAGQAPQLHEAGQPPEAERARQAEVGEHQEQRRRGGGDGRHLRRLGRRRRLRRHGRGANEGRRLFQFAPRLLGKGGRGARVADGGPGVTFGSHSSVLGRRCRLRGFEPAQ